MPNINMKDKNVLSEEVRVVAVEKGHIRIRAILCEDCSVCAAGEGCRNSRLFRLFAPQRQEFLLPVSKARDYRVDDILEISFSYPALVTASAFAYIFPLFLLLVLTVTGHYVFSLSEPQLLLFILISGVFLFLFLRKMRIFLPLRRFFVPHLSKKSFNKPHI